MDDMEIMRSRHSVRRFRDEPLSAETVSALREEIARCNAESGLHFQLYADEPEAFDGNQPSYGAFSRCKNYFALVGAKGKDEAVGYYGERLVLAAQALGVNSCWVALTYRKGKTKVAIEPGETLYMVIALGYGETQGAPRRSKSAEDVSDVTPDAPDWYKRGLEAALLAPTAVNQQKFRFRRSGDAVSVKAGFGFYVKVDLGIVKYHFERGAGSENFHWA